MGNNISLRRARLIGSVLATPALGLAPPGLSAEPQPPQPLQVRPLPLQIQSQSPDRSPDQADSQAPDLSPRVVIAPAISEAQLDDTLTVVGDELDAKQLRSRLNVNVHINDRGPYRFVVDSGADTSVVSETLANQLGLPSLAPAMMIGMTETRLVKRAGVETMNVGSNTIYDLEVPVLRRRDIGGDGMIGLDALAGQRMMMDFVADQITIEDGRVPEPVLDGVITVKGKLRRGQLMLTRVSADQHSLDAVIDSGSEITIGNNALRKRLERNRLNLVSKVTIVGVTGAPFELEVIVIPVLKIGDAQLSNVPVAFADIPVFEAFAMNKKPSLILGTDLMNSFSRVSLDFENKKVRFQLRRCDAADNPPMADADSPHGGKIPLIGAGHVRKCRKKGAV